MAKVPYATVFIPTYFGIQYIETLLKQVLAQKVDFAFEVLIWDTSSTDGTAEIIQKYASKHANIRHKNILKKDYGHGKTRRDAAYDAKGEIVVYLSQDALPAHDRWLYEITKPFSLNNKIVGVLGKQVPRSNAFPLLKYEINAVFGNFGPNEGTNLFYKDDFVQNQGQYDFISFYSDVNSAARKSILTGEIPYQPVGYAEDQLFGRDLINAGYIKAFAPRGAVMHSNDVPLKEYSARMFDETMGLRRAGVDVSVPRIRLIAKLIVKGILKDSVRIIFDKDYSIKRKLFWLVINPLYHIEKWKGIRKATLLSVDDAEEFKKYSLEEQKASGRE